VPAARQASSPHFAVPARAPPPSALRRAGRELELTEPGERTRWQALGVSLDAALREAVEASLRQHHSAYASLEVRSVERLTSQRLRDSFCVKTRGFGSRFCQCKGDEHSQATVYFLLSKRGVTQRCFSRKPVSRRGGLCEKYSSAPSPATAELLRLLWPDAPKAQACSSGLDLAAQLWGV
jgi:hypothetical protein